MTEKISSLKSNNLDIKREKLFSGGSTVQSTPRIVTLPSRQQSTLSTPLVNTLGPGVGVTKLHEIVRSDYSAIEKFSCGKYRPNEYGKKEFYLARSGEGKEWCRLIFEQLKLDWNKMKFNVLLTINNEILVQFHMNPYAFSRTEYDALTHYMNQMAKHGLGLQLNLRKRGDRWGLLEDIDDSITAHTNNTNNTNTTKSSNQHHHKDIGDTVPPSSSSTTTIKKQDHITDTHTTSSGSDDNTEDNHLKRPEESIPPNNNNNNNNNNNSHKVYTHYLSYSMYTPWVNTATLSVHKATSQFDRQRTRAKVEYMKSRSNI